ncbi:MAG: alginate lyase family protein [Sulfolobales archaeon]
MKLYTLENEYISVEIDLDTGVVTQLIDKISGAKHLFSRKPELELRKPGMGLFILEPAFCENPANEIISDSKILFRCSPNSDMEIMWIVSLEDRFVRYIASIRNMGSNHIRSRIRIAIYLACSRGGFWGDQDVEGASYSCRYYVSFEEPGRRDTFSSINVPGTPRGYWFKKHSYDARYFPNSRWIAVLDSVLRNGLAIYCPSRCLIATEDQFFDLEVDIFSEFLELRGGEEKSLEILLIPFRGMGSVHYVSEDLIASIDSPSIALPGDPYIGSLIIYPLKDLSCDVKGSIVYDKNMASIGRRGYCIDRVNREFREAPLKLSSTDIDLKSGLVTKIDFSSIEPIQFRMDRELYEIPDVEFRLCGGRYVIRRTFTIQPEARKILDKLPERKKDYFYRRFIYENELIESYYSDTQAMHSLYLLVSRPPNLKKILKKDIDDIVLTNHMKKLVEKYLEIKNIYEGIEKLKSGLDSKVLLYNFNLIDLAFLYMLSRNRGIVDLLINILRKIVGFYERGDLVTYYTAIHGGGSGLRFVHMALALDLFDRYLDDELRSDLAYMLNDLGFEIYKMTNVWAGNWEFAEASNLLAIGSKIISSLSDLYRNKALTVLSTLEYTFLRDGGSVELAVGYHHYDLESIVSGAEILYYTGDESLYRLALEGEGEEIIRRGLKWIWRIATPYNTAPALEDTNEFIIPSDLFVIGYLRYGDDELGYIARRLWETRPYLTNPLSLLALILSGRDIFEEHVHREFRRDKIYVLRDSGRFVYRESEDPDSFYLILDFGPHGGWHGHPDKLSFEVYYRREPLIVDAGSGGYYNPIHWNWNRKSIAHNTVTRSTEDHLEIRGEIEDLKIYGEYVEALFRADIYRDVRLHRRLIIRGSGEQKRLEVSDEIIGDGLFRWNLHVKGSCDVVDDRIILCRSSRSNIEIKSLEESIWRIDKGLRGVNEPTVYLYREKMIKDRDIFRTLIEIK